MKTNLLKIALSAALLSSFLHGPARASEENSATVQLNVSLEHAKLAFEERNFESAWDALFPLAEGGNPEAQLFVAAMFYFGNGVPQSYAKALPWYQSAAEQGNADAQYYLAVMYDEGVGAIESHETAVSWFERAAQQGHAESQHSLAVRYAHGRGVEQSDQISAMWSLRAAEQGHTEAQYRQARIYLEGVGVVADIEAGVGWIREAATNGHPLAQFSLGVLFESGLYGIAEDAKAAKFWYEKSARQGNSRAQYALGLLYFVSGMAPSDNANAHLWLSQAASADDSAPGDRNRAQSLLEILEATMTRDQITAAKLLSLEFLHGEQ